VDDIAIDRNRWLQSIPLFRNVTSSAVLAELADAMELRAFEAGHVIVREGEPGDTLIINVAGRTIVTVDGQTINRQGPGDHFGELTMFEPSLRSATVTALEPCQCLALSQAALANAMRKTPRFAFNLTRSLSERIQRLNELRVISHTGEVPTLLDPTATPFELLRAIPLFGGLADEAFLRRVSLLMKEATFEPGSEVFRKGDAGDVMYVVLAGDVRVHIDERTLCELGSGHHFGELALLNGETRSASVTAITPCRMLTLTQQQLGAALGQSPTVAENVLRVLARRVRELTSLVVQQHAAVELPAVESHSMLPYLEVSADSLWVQDEATGTWRMPLNDALAQEFSRLAAVESESGSAQDATENIGAADETPGDGGVDDFQRALALEQHALRELLDAARPEARECNASLTAGLYSALRSPVFPKKGYMPLAEALADCFSRSRALRVRGVLASPTAIHEVPFFLKAADTFRTHGLEVDLRFLMVRWENFVDVCDQPLDERASTFEAQVSEVRAVLARHDWSDAKVDAIDVAVGRDNQTLRAPRDFEESIARLEAGAKDMSALPPRVSKDLLWITGFYARQASLHRLGEFQPRLDLALRRAIGRRFSAETGGPAVMLTSELNKRFLPCYDAALPMMNINVRADA